MTTIPNQPDTHPDAQHRPLTQTRLAGAIAITGATLTLIGWFLNIPRLTDWRGDGISMFANTAVAVLAAGVALIILTTGFKRAAIVLGALVAFIGAATLFEHITHVDLHIDNALLQPTWGQLGTTVLGRMGLPASISFAVLGSMIVLSNFGRRARRVASAGSLLVIAITALSLTGYLFGANSLYSIPNMTGIAMQSAALLFVLGCGLSASMPEIEPLRTLTERSAAGALVRRALPFTILIPVIVGGLCLKAELAGYLDSAFEDAIMVVMLIGLLTCLLYWSAAAVRVHESALIANELFSRSIVESSRDCIKTLSPDGIILWVNETGLRLLCIDKTTEVVGRSWIGFWGADSAAAQEAVKKAAAGGTGEFVGSLTIKGQSRWWEVVITPLLGYREKPEKLLAVSRDITERKQAEQARLQLAAVVESSEDAIVSKSLDGIIRSWNPAAQRMFGYAAEEVIGKSIVLLFPSDRLNEEEDIIGRLQRGERVEHFETVRLRKGGEPVHVSLSISPIRDDRGNIIGAAKIARDITEQKRAAQALAEEARNLEILNETGKAIASTLELEKLVQTVTDAGAKLSGAKFGAFFYNVVNEQGESFLLYTLSGAPREAFEKFGLPRNTPVFEPTFRGEGVFRSADITKDPRYGTMTPHHGMPKGHLPVCSYLAVPVVSRSGEVIGGLFFGHPEPNVFTERAERLLVSIAAQAATAIDNARLYEARKKEIEQRIIAEEKLQSSKDEAERANRAKDEFLAIVSHELRTPLTAMLGWTRMLMSGVLDEAKSAHAIRVIERNVKIQTQLIEDLLDLSRVITGKLVLTLGPVDLLKVSSAAIESIKPAADAKHIVVELICAASVSTIAGDAGRLQQVFWNLLANAVKFTPKGGKVSIELKQVDSTVRITVVDSGKGIEPEFLPHLFERFRQSDSTTTRVYGGLGLGLAIVRHLVEQHGGRVEARSEGLGKGSSFTVDLPVRAIMQKEIAAARPLEPRQLKNKPLAGLHILVIEDENDSRDLILTVLNTAGASGIGAATVDQAFSELALRTPDAIISDIGMPLKDGFEFISELRRHQVHSRIPVMALTAYAREEDRRKAREAGFDMHAPKPIDPTELVRNVAELVGR